MPKKNKLDTLKQRIRTLEDKARASFIESLSGGWSEVLDALPTEDKRRLMKLEHQAYGHCNYCVDGFDDSAGATDRCEYSK